MALLKFSTNDADNSYENRRRSSKRQRKFKPTRTYPTACLPEQDEELPVGTQCMIMGWGKVKENKSFGNDFLLEAEVS